GEGRAAQLRAGGWSASLTEPPGRVASLFVQDPHGHAGCGDIIAAPDTATGHWWYWFSWAERIAPAHAPAAAADAIISAFQRPADEPPEPAAAAGGQPPPPPAGSPSPRLDQPRGPTCGSDPLTPPHCGPHRTGRSQ